MNFLFIIKDALSGSEKPYHALRLALTFLKEHIGVVVRLFSMGDAVSWAFLNPSTDMTIWSILLKSLLNRNGVIKARGLKNVPLPEALEINTMSQLAQWTLAAEKVFVF